MFNSAAGPCWAQLYQDGGARQRPSLNVVARSWRNNIRRWCAAWQRGGCLYKRTFLLTSWLRRRIAWGHVGARIHPLKVFLQLRFLM
jgi:hypothetical protein